MKISVVIPVKNGAGTLRECLEGIFSQKIDHPLEVLAVDSGSTDGSLDILRAYPVRVIQVPPEDFSHGDTRNLGASESTGDLIVFTVQDALPADEHWLARLAGNLLNDENAAGAFSRIIPRPACGPLVERGVRGDLNFGSERIETAYEDFRAPEGWDPLTRRVRANFNDVASVLRRTVWEKIPFQRTPFGEDIIWADSVLRAGYKIIFDPESVVIHSHEYRPGSIYPRTHIDGWFNRAYFERICIEKLSHVFIMTWRFFKEDRSFLRTKSLGLLERWRESATSVAYHFMEFLGYYMGGRTCGRLTPLAPLEQSSIKVLFGLGEEPGGDPEGAEAVIELARQMRARGLEAAFLRSGKEEGGAPFTRESYEGFTLFRVHGSQDAEPQAKAFKAVLESWTPDVVHALDFRAFTSCMLDVCTSMRLPCLATLSDFWFRCPRGDLVRPDGAHCSTKAPPGLGCAPCMAGQHEYIFPATLVDRLAGGWVDKVIKLKPKPCSGERPFKRIPGLNPGGYSRRPERMRHCLEGVDFVVVPSLFYRTKCLEAGISPDKVVHIDSEESMARCAGELIVKYRQVLGRRNYLKRAGLLEERSAETETKGGGQPSCRA